MFRFLDGNYGGFNRTRILQLLGVGWITERRRDFMRIWRGKYTKLEVDLIAILDTLTRFQMVSWWEWDESVAPLL